MAGPLMSTWDDVRRLAAQLPEAEESTSYRKPSFKVRGKMFAAISPHEEGALVVRCDAMEKPLLIESRPDVYYSTPHYDRSAYVLIRLDAAEDGALRERLEDSWLIAAPPKLAATLQPG
jgi:hypothetical protein